MPDTEKIASFAGKKILRLVSLLAVVCFVSFMLIQYSPIDPVRAYIGEMTVSEEHKAKLEEYWGVNTPPQEKFLNWAGNILKGDFGTSLIYRMPVADVIKERSVASFVLMATSWLFSGVLGFILGIVAGMNKGTWIDRAIKTYCYVLAATPTFWLALVLLMVFSVSLGWFPIGLSVPIGVTAENVTFFDRIQHLILPALTLSLLGVAQIAMFTREKLIEVLSSDYVLFAKARGEKGLDLVLRHGIRNVALPAITLQFLGFSELFGGAVLVEQVFSYPGIGQAAVAAGLRSDVPLLLGVVIFSAIFVFCGNLIADIIYEFVDPRIKQQEATV
ncbi:ABC transporter permease [Methanosarcina mazei]|uniref:ABC transporter permease n=3 Tax=Methanosarcina mazei TaxID=2209 RepID=A0A0F8EJA1_METMZ|nr:ABC transporter permease [Methanosarcina mazei]AKB61213.1 Dipeptide transport system permease protein DppB [Methanosarcina mazei SarPi]KKF98646.1 ABC transporter permease [Methanosarcina mazei]KKG08045.1 ABC transporter permease [Methanosarcina mazei]KKG32828.1 ABC transporter permease [Methanosarcina mazei]KKG54560.1 ABC transporter permease [Methanosarcina mazei]